MGVSIVAHSASGKLFASVALARSRFVGCVWIIMVFAGCAVMVALGVSFSLIARTSPLFPAVTHCRELILEGV
jgi:hypothetical protein